MARKENRAASLKVKNGASRNYLSFAKHTLANGAFASLILLGLANAVDISCADEITWKSGTTGNWSAAANWDGGLVPTTADTALITSGKATIDTNIANPNNIFVNNAELILPAYATKSQYGTITLGDGAILSGAGTKNGQDGISGALNIQGGTVNFVDKFFYTNSMDITLDSGSISASEFRIGSNQGQTGNLVQNGGSITVTNWFPVSEKGTATYTMNGGTLTSSGNSFVVGGPGGNGTFTLVDGTVTLTGGQGNGSMAIGWSEAGKGTVNIQGGNLTVNNKGIKVGCSGTGPNSYNQSGGTVEIKDSVGLVINQTTGTAELTGGTLITSKLVNAGRLTFTGGTLSASAITGNLVQGENATLKVTSGTINIEGSAQLNGKIDAAVFPATYIPQITLVNATGGITGTPTVFSSARTSLYDLNSLDNNNLTLNIDPSAYFWNGGDTEGSWDTVGTWMNNGAVSASLPLAAQNNVFITKGTVNATTNSAAKTLVIGDGSGASTAILKAGNGGVYNGLQNIELLKGGTLKGTAKAENQSGTITIDGGTLDYSGQQYFSGSTDITLNSGTILSGEFRVGSQAGATGSITVNGGKLTTTSWISMGENGNGTITLNDGAVTVGSINAACAFVLGGPGGTGKFVMNGGSLTAHGKQTYLNGSPYSVVLGWGAGTTGSMEITGGTLTSDYGFLVGGNGSGTVDQTGGIVFANGENGLNIKAGSTYNLTGGTLYATKITNNGTFNQTGGVLEANSIAGLLNQTGGAISPGGVGVLSTTTMSNNYTLDKDASYQIDIDPSTPLTSVLDVTIPATDGYFSSDLILVNGNATVNGMLDFVLPENYVDDYSQSFVVLAATGDITLGDDLTSSWFGLSLLNVPGVGNALVANRVPEPATWTLLLLGVGGLTLIRNRRKANKQGELAE